MKSHAKSIYYIAYATIKNSKYVKMNSVNPLNLVLNKLSGYFKVIDGSKYLTLVPTNESKEKIKRYEELLIKIRDLIRLVTKKADDYDEKCTKIKLDSDDKLPLNKTIEIPVIFLMKVFLDEYLYEIQKCYIMIQLTFLKDLMLIKQVHQNSVMFVTIGIL